MMLELFDATGQQLLRDHVRRNALFLTIPLCLAVAWTAWMLFSHITMYTSTDQARIEVAQAVYFVQARVSGRVINSRLELGRQVSPGDVLVELEGESQKFRVREEETRRTALLTQLQNLRRELAAQQQSLGAERAAGG